MSGDIKEGVVVIRYEGPAEDRNERNALHYIRYFREGT